MPRGTVEACSAGHIGQQNRISNVWLVEGWSPAIFYVIGRWTNQVHNLTQHTNTLRSVPLSSDWFARARRPIIALIVENSRVSLMILR